MHPEDFKLLCFTFDDGPAYPYYNEEDPAVQIAKLINQYHGSATYFYTGNALRKDQGTLQWLIDQGFEIANHSDTHLSFAAKENTPEPDIETCRKEILNVNELLKPYGIVPKFFRAAGYSTGSNLETVLVDMKLPHIAYQIAVADYSGGTATVESIRAALLEKAVDGAIVGMHSTNKNNVTPTALGQALPILYKQGYRFCSVEELFKLRNVQGIPYGKRIKRVAPNGAVFSF